MARTLTLINIAVSHLDCKQIGTALEALLEAVIVQLTGTTVKRLLTVSPGSTTANIVKYYAPAICIFFAQTQPRTTGLRFAKKYRQNERGAMFSRRI